VTKLGTLRVSERLERDPVGEGHRGHGELASHVVSARSALERSDEAAEDCDVGLLTHEVKWAVQPMTGGHGQHPRDAGVYLWLLTREVQPLARVASKFGLFGLGLDPGGQVGSSRYVLWCAWSDRVFRRR
jgi:hypothetical protein